jgi:C4-dicarboxylate-specific signal transduction histidine kinase
MLDRAALDGSSDTQNPFRANICLEASDAVILFRSRLEEAMLRAEKLAVPGRLAASVAHEINNPMESVANLHSLITHAETTEAAHAQADARLADHPAEVTSPRAGAPRCQHTL